MPDYRVDFNGYEFEIEAETRDKAKYKAWVIWSKEWSTSFIDFVRSVRVSVNSRDGWRVIY